jgi:hypothetical protein
MKHAFVSDTSSMEERLVVELGVTKTLIPSLLAESRDDDWLEKLVNDDPSVSDDGDKDSDGDRWEGFKKRDNDGDDDDDDWDGDWEDDDDRW